MRRTQLRYALALSGLLVGLVGLGTATADDQKNEGFTALFNGRDLNGWKAKLKGNTEPGQTWSVRDGVVVCTGHPNGFGYSEKTYKNYVLRYDWRYARPEGLKDDKDFKGNSGALVHIQDPDVPVRGGIWPKCVEVQGMNLRHGEILFLECKGKATYNREAKDKAVKPVGEWNTTEITCKADGTITAKINGIPVSSGKGELTEGHIGFQSEGAEIHFRNILLKELK